MTVSEILNLLTGNQIAGTVFIVVVVIVVRLGVQRFLAHREGIEPEQRRRLLSNLRNSLFFVLLVGLALVWAPSLRTFALSLTAFAVAIILATKELILCISGSFVKTASGSMQVGNWVEVSGVRGEILDQTLMTTTIQELGKDQAAYEFTGRTIVLPNSIFLTVPAINEQFFKRYVFHAFQIVVDVKTNIALLEKAMVDTVNKEMGSEWEIARRYLALIEKRSGFDIQGPEPRTRIEMLDDGKVKLILTAFLPTRRAIDIEQKAMRAGLFALSKSL